MSGLQCSQLNYVRRSADDSEHPLLRDINVSFGAGRLAAVSR